MYVSTRLARYIVICAAAAATFAGRAYAAPVTIDLGGVVLVDIDPSETAGSYFDIDFDNDGTVDIFFYHQFMYEDGDVTGAYSDVVGGDSCVGGCGPAPTGPASFWMYSDPVTGDLVFPEPLPGAWSTSPESAQYAMFFENTVNELYDNPWLTAGTSYMTGLFTIGNYYHPFFVELAVDSVDGRLTLESAGYDTSAVPEPASLLLLGGGLTAMARRRLRARA